MSSTAEAKTLPASVSRATVGDYVELMKLRLVTLVLVTTAVGFCVGYPGAFDLAFVVDLASTVFGTALVAGAAMVLNQYMERDGDARMHRTRNRPLPTGRVTPVEALLFGSALAVLGMLYLWMFVEPRASILSAITLASYLFAYTPLKTRTPLCTLVGAIPGAIPPMMGYVAAAHAITTPAWILFGILFIWQMPHFFAIAWVYRTDYARGGHRMLPVVDPSGVRTARQIVGFSLALFPVTLAPTVIGMTGGAYFAGALALGLAFLAFGLLVAIARSDQSARRMFLASVMYLPVLLGLMVLDRIPY